MPAFTGPLTVNGTLNLGALLRTAGFLSGGRPTLLIIDNPSTTVKCYVHFTNSSSAAPGTGTNGIPLSAGAFPERRNLDMFGSQQGDIHDLNLIWLHTPSSIPITVAVVVV